MDLISVKIKKAHTYFPPSSACGFLVSNRLCRIKVIKDPMKTIYVSL